MADALWILIAAANKAELLHRTLSSLAATVKPPSYRGTIVVENGNRCGIETVIRGFAREHRFHHMYVPEANKSHALNCGLTRIDDSLVFMTDDDVRFDPQVLLVYDQAAQGCTGGRVYGGQVHIDAEHGLPPEWIRRFYPLTIVEPWSLPYQTPSVVPNQTFMGTNWAAFARDMLGVGGFDTRLGPGDTTVATGDETEIQRRMLAHGVVPIYLPDAITWHYLHAEYLKKQWLLERTYRHALEWGVRRTRDHQSIIYPIFRAILGRLNAHAKAVVLRLLGGEQRRFAAAFHKAKWRGRWNGLWLGMDWDHKPQLSVPTATDFPARAA